MSDLAWIWKSSLAQTTNHDDISFTLLFKIIEPQSWKQSWIVWGPSLVYLSLQWVPPKNDCQPVSSLVTEISMQHPFSLWLALQFFFFFFIYSAENWCSYSFHWLDQILDLKYINLPHVQLWYFWIQFHFTDSSAIDISFIHLFHRVKCASLNQADPWSSSISLMFFFLLFSVWR